MFLQSKTPFTLKADYVLCYLFNLRQAQSGSVIALTDLFELLFLWFLLQTGQTA